MNREGHVQICELLLGYSIPEVDALLDDLEALKAYGPSHRIFRHGSKDLELIKELLGSECYRVALLHILADHHLIDERILEIRRSRQDQANL